MKNDTIPTQKCPFKRMLQGLSKDRGQPLSAADIKVDHKKRLHKVSAFFIEETWKIIGSGFAEACLTEIYSKRSKDDLKEYLNTLQLRDASFAWAWIRARITDTLYANLEDAISVVSESHSREWEQYRKLLLKNGYYWFRQTQKQHLKVGYHTAVSVISKLVGTKVFDNSGGYSEEWSLYIKECSRIFASFDLELLTATDSVLWDSAGATHFKEYEIKDNELFLPETLVDLVKARLHENSHHIESRLGCPALRAGGVFEGFFDAVAHVFRDVL